MTGTRCVDWAVSEGRSAAATKLQPDQAALWGVSNLLRTMKTNGYERKQTRRLKNNYRRINSYIGPHIGYCYWVSKRYIRCLVYVDWVSGRDTLAAVLGTTIQSI